MIGSADMPFPSRSVPDVQARHEALDQVRESQDGLLLDDKHILDFVQRITDFVEVVLVHHSFTVGQQDGGKRVMTEWRFLNH